MIESWPALAGAHIAEVGVEPVAAGPTLAGGEDLDLLAGLELVGERHDAPIDLGAAAAVANLGMHAVGEVDGRGDTRQVDDVPVRGEHVDTIRRHVAGEPFAQVAEVADLLLPLQHLAQPGDLLFVAGTLAAGVVALVAPVGADAELGLVVHGEGADLDLQHLILGAEHSGVQRLVAVLLGIGNVVVELVGHMVPARVHQSQHGVAIGQRRHQDAHGAHVVDLGEIDALALHLAPDRIDVLRSAVDLVVGDAVGLQEPLEYVHHIMNVAVAIEALLRQLAGDGLVVILVQVAEGEILEFPLDLADAQAMRQRRIDVEHLTGNLQTLLARGVLHLAQGAGTLGDLDQRHAHVVDHVDQHLAQIVLLVVLGHAVAGALHLADGRHLQHAVDQTRHLAAEAAAHGLQGELPFAHGAIEHGSLQGRLVELELAEDIGHLEAHAKARVLGQPGLVRLVSLL